MSRVLDHAPNQLSWVAHYRFNVTENASREKFESAREPGANADSRKISSIAGENAVNLAALGYSSYQPVDQPKAESFEFGVQF